MGEDETRRGNQFGHVCIKSNTGRSSSEIRRGTVTDKITPHGSLLGISPCIVMTGGKGGARESVRPLPRSKGRKCAAPPYSAPPPCLAARLALYASSSASSDAVLVSAPSRWAT